MVGELDRDVADAQDLERAVAGAMDGLGGEVLAVRLVYLRGACLAGAPSRAQYLAVDVMKGQVVGYGVIMAKDPLKDVEDEIAQQAAIDASDSDPPTKVEARDAARDELEAKQDVEPEPGPNPA